MSKFCIDAGHNYSGADTGAVGRVYVEQDLSFRIADSLKSILQNAGHEVKMTRETSQSNVPGATLNDSLTARARISNDFNADYFVSVHLNAGGGVGAETYVLARGGEAEKIATRVQTAFTALGRVNRGVKTANFAVLRLTDCPAILVEVGFIDNEQEEKWIAENVEKIAWAISAGFGIKPDEEYMTAVEAVAFLTSVGVIKEPDKWYSGTWDDEDMKWLLRKTAQYIKDSL